MTILDWIAEQIASNNLLIEILKSNELQIKKNVQLIIKNIFFNDESFSDYM